MQRNPVALGFLSMSVPIGKECSLSPTNEAHEGRSLRSDESCPHQSNHLLSEKARALLPN
ncbi:hypothetical protein QL093DRAFT_2382668 [Fusarium oxysporum]|nr:hypothetical protein QL093DRAFT_2382668 [Fusarium oxysporum]